MRMDLKRNMCILEGCLTFLGMSDDLMSFRFGATQWQWTWILSSWLTFKLHTTSKVNFLPYFILNLSNSIFCFTANLSELKTYHEVVDEIYYKVQHLEPWEKGSRKTSGQTGMCGGVSCFQRIIKWFYLTCTIFRYVVLEPEGLSLLLTVCSTNFLLSN